MNSFCFQCEQTFQGTACNEMGICGKDQESSVLQDLIVHACKGLAQYARRARRLGVVDPQIDELMLEALFATVTNVNFDPERLGGIADELAVRRDRARRLYLDGCAAAGEQPEAIDGPSAWVPEEALEAMLEQAQAREISELGRRDLLGEDVHSLPLSMVLSWYEQKAVAILLTLLHLGIRDIRLGPSLPAFVSKNVLQVMVDTFNLTPITTPEADLQAMLGA
jgi:hydroxylamine reductase (hybrid-cluster protein)